MGETIKIAIVDEQPIYRYGLAQILTSQSYCHVVAEGGTSEEAVRIASDLRPDIMLLDSHVPAGGIKTLWSISEGARDMRTIVMTSAETERDLAASFEAGARGYVSKDVKVEQLRDIVDTVHRGKMYMEPTFAGVLMSNRFNGKSNLDNPLGSLTVREEQVLRRVIKGHTNKEIAREHGLSEKTVKHHMTNILQKLQARNRVEAVIIVRERFGWT